MSARSAEEAGVKVCGWKRAGREWEKACQERVGGALLRGAGEWEVASREAE